MEFYILGVVFFLFGVGLKSLALRCGWIREGSGKERKLWLVLFLTLTVTVYFLNILVTLALFTLLLELGLHEPLAAGVAWVATLIVVLGLCGIMGWVIEFGHRASPNFNPYADESPHPFGTDALDTGIDIHADDNADPKRP